MQHPMKSTKEIKDRNSSQVICQENNNQRGTEALSIGVARLPRDIVFNSFEEHEKRSFAQNDIPMNGHDFDAKRQRMAAFDLTNDSYNSSSGFSFTGFNNDTTVQKQKSFSGGNNCNSRKEPECVAIPGVLRTHNQQKSEGSNTSIWTSFHSIPPASAAGCQNNVSVSLQDSQDMQDSHIQVALRSYLTQIKESESQQQQKSFHSGSTNSQESWSQLVHQQKVKLEPQEASKIPSVPSEADQLQLFLAQSAMTLSQWPNASLIQPNFHMSGQSSSSPGVNNADTNLQLYAFLAASIQNSNQQQQQQQPRQQYQAQSASMDPAFTSSPSTGNVSSNLLHATPSCLAATINRNNASGNTSDTLPSMDVNANHMTMLDLMLKLLNKQPNENNSIDVHSAGPPPFNSKPTTLGEIHLSENSDAASFAQSLVNQQKLSSQPQKSKSEENATKIAAVPAVPPKPSKPITNVSMEMKTDCEQLSPYQVMIRQQLEYFVSKKEDTDYSVQGRKKRAHVGQVGIRCKHCSDLPHRLRGRGAVYYPSKLSGVYQAAQNMATNHLNQFCSRIPTKNRKQLIQLRGGRNDSSAGAGKQYWAETGQQLGIVESPDGLHFKGQPMETNPFITL